MNADPFEAPDSRLARLHILQLARLLAPGPDILDLAHESPANPDPADLVIARYTDAAALPGLRALLRQGGLLLIDAEAIDPAALLAELRRHFPAAALLRQAGLIGSAVLPDTPGRAPPAIFTRTDPLHTDLTATLPQDRLLVLAGDTLPDLPCLSLLIDQPPDRLATLSGRAAHAEAALARLQADHDALRAEAGAARRTDAKWRHDLAVLRVAAAAATTESAQVAAQRDGIANTSMAMIRRVQELEQAATARADALATENAALHARLAATPALRPTLRARLAGRLAARGTAPPPGFDPEYYRATYPDTAGIDPARHYRRHGAAEGRNPRPDFDAAWYAATHNLSGLAVLDHWHRHGGPTRAPLPEAAPPPPARPPNPAILWVAGEADTPGAQYRCARYAEAARQAGHDAGWSDIRHTGAIELQGVRVAILWRVRWSRHVEGVMAEIRQQGGTVVFDVDDLMIRPELARTSIIDGIRTTNAGIGSTRETFAQVQQAMTSADLCTTTTEELADHMRAFQKASYILPNGFDAETLAASRLAVRRRALAPSDRLVRIGYAAGTVTHQKDFAVALPALLRLLADRDQTRLVLFRSKDGPDLVVIDEFEALAPYADRIEWRDKVELPDLPAELARFDINLAPLEVGNPFCEAKSELKWFEAALVSVPTIASPTGPYRRCIVHGATGMLAETDEQWHEALLRLTDDAALRQTIGRRAFLACLYPFGPECRASLVDSFLQQIAGTQAGAQAFALAALRPPAPPPMDIPPPAELLFRADRLGRAEVTVIVPCYNYAEFVLETLESVRAQSLDLLDLVVIDDASPDPLATTLILEWVRTHQDRFNRVLVLRHLRNAGLSAARNTGFEAAETPYVLPLDADNRLLPECCATLLDAMSGQRLAFAYSSLRMFGASDSVFCNERWQPMRLVGGNYVDAMAMIARWAWAMAGGYSMPRTMGWEDFDLWCRIAEQAGRGLHVPRILAEYRVHGGSMVSNLVEIDVNKQAMVTEIESRHPWLRLSSRTPHDRV